MDEHIRHRLVDLGDSAEAFMESSLGRAVHEQMEADCDELRRKLVTVSPWSGEEIRKIQTDILAREFAWEWLVLMIDGRNVVLSAEAQVEDDDEYTT